MGGLRLRLACGRQKCNPTCGCCLGHCNRSCCLRSAQDLECYHVAFGKRIWLHMLGGCSPTQSGCTESVLLVQHDMHLSAPSATHINGPLTGMAKDCGCIKEHAGFHLAEMLTMQALLR